MDHSQLHTTHHLLSSRTPSPSLIHIRSIPFTLPLGLSCWGQPNIVQPVLISASVHFHSPFEAASRLDALDSGTVSYSVLAKEITEFVKVWEGGESWTGCVVELVRGLMVALCGWDWNEKKHESGVVDTEVVDVFEVGILLPKASMLGEGVSVKTMMRYESGRQVDYASRLELRRLRVSTLIGLRDYERKCRQQLIVTVVVDGWMDRKDQYVTLEMIVTKVCISSLPPLSPPVYPLSTLIHAAVINKSQTIEESSLQTLEALSHHIAQRILEFYIIPDQLSSRSNASEPSWGPHPQLRICLEKPNMVPCSEAPAVEILFDCDPVKNAGAKRVWDRVMDGNGKGRRPPIPLEGRLDEWITGEGLVP